MLPVRNTTWANYDSITLEQQLFILRWHELLEVTYDFDFRPHGLAGPLQLLAEVIDLVPPWKAGAVSEHLFNDAAQSLLATVKKHPILTTSAFRRDTDTLTRLLTNPGGVKGLRQLLDVWQGKMATVDFGALYASIVEATLFKEDVRFHEVEDLVQALVLDLRVAGASGRKLKEYVFGVFIQDEERDLRLKLQRIRSLFRWTQAEYEFLFSLSTPVRSVRLKHVLIDQNPALAQETEAAHTREVPTLDPGKSFALVEVNAYDKYAALELALTELAGALALVQFESVKRIPYERVWINEGSDWSPFRTQGVSEPKVVPPAFLSYVLNDPSLSVDAESKLKRLAYLAALANESKSEQRLLTLWNALELLCSTPHKSTVVNIKDTLSASWGLRAIRRELTAIGYHLTRYDSEWLTTKQRDYIDRLRADNNPEHIDVTRLAGVLREDPDEVATLFRFDALLYYKIISVATLLAEPPKRHAFLNRLAKTTAGNVMAVYRVRNALVHGASHHPKLMHTISQRLAHYFQELLFHITLAIQSRPDLTIEQAVFSVQEASSDLQCRTESGVSSIEELINPPLPLV